MHYMTLRDGAGTDVTVLGPDTPRVNNAGDRGLTTARTDRQIIEEWYNLYKDSPRTYNTYYREGTRLRLWLKFSRIGLADFTVAHVQLYREFLSDPQPAGRWCVMPHKPLLPDGSPNPEFVKVKPLRREPEAKPQPEPGEVLVAEAEDDDADDSYRPFLYAGLSESAVKQSMAIVSGLFAYCVKARYLKGNPFMVGRTRQRYKKKQDQTIERYLEPEAWASVKASFEKMPRKTARDERHYQRNKFLLSFFYLTGLRREEMAEARTDGLKRLDGDMWIEVTGKGLKTRLVPLPDDAIEIIKAYRTSLGKTPWPEPGTAPEGLVFDVYGKGNPLKEQAIYQIVKDALHFAADNEADPQAAYNLKEASTHWLRHTCATVMAQSGVDLIELQKTLGHGSMATTARYLHTGRKRQHEQVRKHRL